jgi:hypothetical protein
LIHRSVILPDFLVTSQELILALDFGGSSTKGIYCTLKQNIPTSLVMEPEVVKISLDSVTSETLGTTEPENAAWVNYMGETFAVGYLAKRKYYANEGLKELKYERAVAKTLASIWATSQKLQLGTKFRLALVCLLPPGEFENKERLHKSFRKAGTGNWRISRIRRAILGIFTKRCCQFC